MDIKFRSAHKREEGFLRYVPIGRRLLLNDDNPVDGGRFYANKDVWVHTYQVGLTPNMRHPDIAPENLVFWRASDDAKAIMNVDRSPEQWISPPEIEFGTITLRARACVDANKSFSYDVHQRALDGMTDSMDREEDYMVFVAINKAVPGDRDIKVTGSLFPENLNLGCALLESDDLEAAHILMHPQRLKDVRAWAGKDAKDLILRPREEARKDGVYGKFQEHEILVSTMAPRNAVYVVSDAEHLGIFGIEQKRTTHNVYYSDVERRHIEMSERVGVVIVNDRAIVRVIVS